MRCERCNARIHYRFLTNCAQCGSEIKRANLAQNNPVANRQLERFVEPILTWKQEAINVVHIFVSSISGMISGAVVGYFFVGITYLALSSPDPSAGCGWGSVVGLLSLLSGALVGTVGGSLLAVKNPLCKGARNL